MCGRSHPAADLVVIAVTLAAIYALAELIACATPVPKAVDCRVEFAARAADAGCLCARDAGGD
jgi:hypothetical protein